MRELGKWEWVVGREVVDREADVWRKEGGLRRDEVNVCRLEESQHLVGVAADWLELDSSDEGIRFDSELVSVSLPYGLAGDEPADS